MDKPGHTGRQLSSDRRQRAYLLWQETDDGHSLVSVHRTELGANTAGAALPGVADGWDYRITIEDLED